LNGSLTLAMNRSAEVSTPRATSEPIRIIIRIAVGAVYQTVAFCTSRMPSQRSASNSAASTIRVAPLVSGEMMP